MKLGFRKRFLSLTPPKFSSFSAFFTPAARRVPAFWAEVEQHRKRPWRIVHALGMGMALRFLLRRPTLSAALDLASERVGARVREVLLTHPEAGFDVDKASDHAIAEACIRERERLAASRTSNG